MLTKSKSVLNTKNKSITLIPALIWAGIIAFISLVPGDELPQTNFHINDKLVHFLIYFSFTGVLFASLYPYLRLSSNNNPLRDSLIISSLISFAYGTMIEFLQEYMNMGRSADLYDVLANLSGIIIAVFTILIFKVNRLLVKVLGI